MLVPIITDLPWNKFYQLHQLVWCPIRQSDLKGASLYQLLDKRTYNLWVVLVQGFIQRLFVLKFLQWFLVLLKLLLLFLHALNDVVYVRHNWVLPSVEILVVFGFGFVLWLERIHYHFHVVILFFFELFQLFALDNQASVNQANHVVLAVWRYCKSHYSLRKLDFVLKAQLIVEVSQLVFRGVIENFEELDLRVETRSYHSLSFPVKNDSHYWFLESMDRAQLFERVALYFTYRNQIPVGY